PALQKLFIVTVEIEGVQGTDFRRNGYVSIVPITEMGQRRDQSGHDNFSGGIDHLRTGRDRNIRSDGRDLSVTDQDDSVRDHRAAHGNDPASSDGYRLAVRHCTAENEDRKDKPFSPHLSEPPCRSIAAATGCRSY